MRGGGGKIGKHQRLAESVVPSQPANAQWSHNSCLALFIPAKPLAAGTTYVARFLFEGADKPVEWTFTTAAP